MHVQRRWNLNTKTMLNAVAVSIVALDVYGMLGVWTQAVGFHHRWEFWVYQIWYGLMVCPWYSYSQTMVRLLLIPRLLLSASDPLKGSCPSSSLSHSRTSPLTLRHAVDLRGHTPRQGVPLLLPLQHSRQSLLIRRSHHLQRYH